MPTDSQSQPSDTLIDRVLVGSRLRAHRKQQKFTLKQVSEKSGVALSTLSKMELGQATVSYDKLAAAARVLNVSLPQLFNPESGQTGQISQRWSPAKFLRRLGMLLAAMNIILLRVSFPVGV